MMMPGCRLAYLVVNEVVTTLQSGTIMVPARNSSTA